MRIATHAAFGRLLALVAGLALLTSRVAMLAHEFGGHALPATLFGGRVTGWYLFLFAGGRVSYLLGDLGVGRRLVVSLGGIAVELIGGGIALLVARRSPARGVRAFCALVVGTVLGGHAAIYLARGVHYGYGDGALLARVLGGAREVLVTLASALAIGMAFAGGQRLASLPAALFGGSVRRATGLTLLVFACAGLVHGALAGAEVRWFPDPAWVTVMEDASVGSARAEVARRIAEARRRGEPIPSDDELRRMQEALERARRPWPLDPVLLTAVLASLAVGVRRGASQERGEAEVVIPTWRTIGSVAGALAAAIGVILLLRRG